MAVIFKFRCPDCGEVFKQPAKPDWEFCPACGTELISSKGEIVMPALQFGAGKVADKVYRDMENASIERAETAASMFGAPASEFSDMKITNLRDNTKVGEAAAIPANNEISRAIDAAPPQAMQTLNSLGPTIFSQGTQNGPYPNQGARWQTNLRKMHAETYGHHLVGDNPGNEVMDPRYRRRA